MEIIELKNTIMEMIHSVDGQNSKVETEDKINEFDIEI